MMKPELFLADLEAKPEALAAVHATLGSTWAAIGRPQRIVLAGMGSSHFANAVAAARLQSNGVDATAVIASTDLKPAVGAEDLVILVSAGGSSVETLDAARHYAGRARTVLLTNVDAAPIAEFADLVVPMSAGPEVSGVACRSYQHTLIRLLELEEHLLGGTALADAVSRTAEATRELLASRSEWVPNLAAALAGPDGTTFVAPARRMASALQSALMLREVPRRQAIACETGDWSHIDVYLTKTLDYRMLLLAGSRWEPELLRWCAERGSTVVGAGAEVPGATLNLRYRHDDQDDVRLLTETLIAELVAEYLWSTASA